VPAAITVEDDVVMSKLGDRRAAKFAAFRLSSARADAEAACPPGWTILDPTHEGDRWTAIARLGDDSELGSGLTPSRALDCLAEALEARFGLTQALAEASVPS